MKMELQRTELESRLDRFCREMDAAYPAWDTALIIGKVNQYYFTGTMQDAVLLIRKDGKMSYHVRLSYQRAVEESPLSCIYPMHSYRDAAQTEGPDLGNVFIEADTLPYGVVRRLGNYFRMRSIGSLENVVRSVRSVKSPYELYWMELSGKQHHKLLTEAVPSLLREGISEAEFVGALLQQMMRCGYQGITRFNKFQTEITAGQIGFGINSLYPTCFDGPGGALGMSPAAPVAGSPGRTLTRGDLVFVDIGFGMGGYHSDKTQVYMFGRQPSDEAVAAHRKCIEIQRRAAEQLKPGAIPSQIYSGILSEISDEFQESFMGFRERTVRFLGHGVGLHVDELPVIAKGFDLPLAENMVIALEPKKGVAGVGMVGVEDTYLVTPAGGRCLTGGGGDIIVV